MNYHKLKIQTKKNVEKMLMSLLQIYLDLVIINSVGNR